MFLISLKKSWWWDFKIDGRNVCHFEVIHFWVWVPVVKLYDRTHHSIFSSEHKHKNRIGGVMFSVLALSVVDCGCEPQLGQIKDYIHGIFCFFTRHVVLRSRRNDCLAWNQANVFNWATCLPAECCVSE